MLNIMEHEKVEKKGENEIIGQRKRFSKLEKEEEKDHISVADVFLAQ